MKLPEILLNEEEVQKAYRFENPRDEMEYLRPAGGRILG